MATGGSSGTVRYATFIENFHWSLLNRQASSWSPTFSVAEIYNATASSNPYTGATFSDPQPSIDELQASKDDFVTFLSQVAPKTDWEDYIQTVHAKLDSLGVFDPIDCAAIKQCALDANDAGITQTLQAVVNATNQPLLDALKQGMSDSIDREVARSLRRFDSYSNKFNTVHSSAFILGKALILTQANKDKADAHAKIESESRQALLLSAADSYKNFYTAGMQVAYQIKANEGTYSVNALQQMLAMREMFQNGQLAKFDQALKLGQFRITATAEHEDALIELSVKQHKWLLDVASTAANVLGAASSMRTNIPDKPSRASSAISGILGGGAAGGALATSLGVVAAGGAAAAAPFVIGAAALGGLAALLNK